MYHLTFASRISFTVFIFLFSASCLAQVDSLADCFPLSVGNKWRFHYFRSIPEGEFSLHMDTGTASYSIVGKVDYGDSVKWNFLEHRLIHRSSWVNGLYSEYAISDSTLFNLIELKSGRHELYRRPSESGPPYYDSSMFWTSVLPFSADEPESSKLFRYYLLDSSNSISFTLAYEPETMIYSVTLGKNSGPHSIMASSTLTSDGGTPYTDYELLNQTLTSIADLRSTTVPTTIHLEQNYPNPFNPLTRIEYDVPTGSQVTLSVYSLFGQKVARLVNSQYQIGHHTAWFDGTNLPSGVYFARLSTDKSVLVRKMALIR